VHILGAAAGKSPLGLPGRCGNLDKHLKLPTNLVNPEYFALYKSSNWNARQLAVF